MAAMTESRSIHCEILVTGGWEDLEGRPPHEVSSSAVISAISTNSNSKIFFATRIVTPAMGLYGSRMSNRGRGAEQPPAILFGALEESVTTARGSSPDPVSGLAENIGTEAGRGPKHKINH